MEETLQHDETTFSTGIQAAGTGGHHPNRPKVGHALTFKLDQLLGRVNRLNLRLSHWTMHCIDHLSRLAALRINHTVDCYWAMAFPNWMNSDEASKYFSAWSFHGDMRSTDIFIRTDDRHS